MKWGCGNRSLTAKRMILNHFRRQGFGIDQKENRQRVVRCVPEITMSTASVVITGKAGKAYTST